MSHTHTYADPPFPLDLTEWVATASASMTSPTVMAVSLDVDFVGYDPCDAQGDNRDPRYVENVMVWVDGELVDAHTSGALSAGQRAALGHTFSFTRVTLRHWEYRWTFSRANLLTEGGTVPVTVALFDNGFRYPSTPWGIAYLDLSVAVPIATKPTVALWPAHSADLLAGIFPITLFNTPPSSADVRSHKTDFVAAGVNALTMQVFNNPRTTGPATYAAWETQFESLVGQWLDWAVANGFTVWGNLDDATRDEAAKTWTTTSPFSTQALQYAFARYRDTGVVLIDGQDEVGGLPTDHACYEVVMDAWRSVPGAPPIAWPALALSYGIADEWETDATVDGGMSSFNSRYQTDWQWRAGKADGVDTGWQLRYSLNLALTDSDPARALALLTSCNGAYYLKYVAGVDFQEDDRLLRAAIPAQSVIAQIWLALAAGASGLRIYAFDDGSPNWKNNRAAGSTTGSEQQTGSRPGGDDRWAALSIACNAIQSRQAALLGAQSPATARGLWVFGERAELGWAVNLASSSQPLARSGTLITTAGETTFTGGSVPSLGVVVDTVPLREATVRSRRSAAGTVTSTRRRTGTLRRAS